MPERIFNRPFDWRGYLNAQRPISAVAIITLIAGSLLIAPSPSLADAETCGDLRMSLSDEFRKQDCTREQHRSAGYDGSAWIETIESSNAEFFLFVASQRASTSRTYMDGTNLERLFRDYDLGSSARMVGEPKRTMDGVEFVTIDNGNSCILFLKEAIPRRGGYGFLASGIGCERDKIGAYSEEDANRMLSHIDFSVR